mmetsp:Transcript_9304/g.20746  ORF Transcript_9304/g.20746 Transcript_9304/m.20746 type:complete len:89 (+) Transcript_9304:750-1016(+)
MASTGTTRTSDLQFWTAPRPATIDVGNQCFKGALLLLQLGKALLTLRDSLSWQLKRKGNLLQRNTAFLLPKDTAVLAKLSLKLRSKVI